MSEYIVDFGDKSSAFVGLAMAEAESHGATLKERVVRCRDCERYHEHGQLCDLFATDEWDSLTYAMVAPDGFCAWGERRDS